MMKYSKKFSTGNELIKKVVTVSVFVSSRTVSKLEAFRQDVPSKNSLQRTVIETSKWLYCSYCLGY